MKSIKPTIVFNELQPAAWIYILISIDEIEVFFSTICFMNPVTKYDPGAGPISEG